MKRKFEKGDKGGGGGGLNASPPKIDNFPFFYNGVYNQRFRMSYQVSNSTG